MNFDNEAKHVVPKAEDLRTRVRSPPPPPYTILSYWLVATIKLLKGVIDQMVGQAVSLIRA